MLTCNNCNNNNNNIICTDDLGRIDVDYIFLRASL